MPCRRQLILKQKKVGKYPLHFPILIQYCITLFLIFVWYSKECHSTKFAKCNSRSDQPPKWQLERYVILHFSPSHAIPPLSSHSSHHCSRFFGPMIAFPTPPPSSLLVFLFPCFLSFNLYVTDLPPKKEKKELPVLPAELQGDDVAFPDLSWAIPIETLPAYNTLKADGKIVQMTRYVKGEGGRVREERTEE